MSKPKQQQYVGGKSKILMDNFNIPTTASSISDDPFLSPTPAHRNKANKGKRANRENKFDVM